MKKAYSNSLFPFPEEFYRRLADQIYTPIQMGESVALLLPPFFGKDHLLHYLRERTSDRERVFGENLPQYFWQYPIIRSAENYETKEWIEQLSYALPRRNKKCTTLEDFFTLLRQTLDEENTHIVFVVNISEDIKLSALQRFFHLANKTLYALPHSIHFILTMYQNWDEATFSQSIVPFNSLFQHIIKPSHRTDDEIRHFIQYRLNVWNHELTREAADLIVKEAGGMPLFAKAAVRIAKKKSMTTLSEIQGLVRTQTEYVERVKLFWYSLRTEQQTLLRQIASGSIPSQNPTIDQLLHIGIVQENSLTRDYSIRSKSLHRFLAGEKIINIQEIAQLAHLSAQEQKVFSMLCSPIGRIVPRDEIAKTIWSKNTEQKYSDWALDKVISRMRQKLASVKNQNKIILTSKKKSGVVLSIL